MHWITAMKPILEKTALEFIELAASDAAVPGGGSVAMVTAAHGLALVMMAVKISRKKATIDLQHDYDQAVNRGEALMKKIIDSVDQDIQVFELLMAAYKLPRATDAEKEQRKSSIQKYTVQATEEPIRAARLCIDGLSLAQETKMLISANVYSDLKAGALLLNAGMQAVLLNVDINIQSLEDEGKAETYRLEKLALLKQGEELNSIF